MPKTKASPKKGTTKKTLKGSGGLKSTNKLSWKKLALFAVPIALIGGFFVYRSYAAGDYTFIHYAEQMDSGRLVTKSGAPSTKYLFLQKGDSDGFLRGTGTWVSNNEAASSTRYCAHYVDGKGGSVNMGITYTLPNGSSSSWYTGPSKKLTGGSGYVCHDINHNIGIPNYAFVQLSRSNSDPDAYIYIDTIYGKP